MFTRYAQGNIPALRSAGAEFKLREYLQILRQRKFTLILSVLAALAAVGAYNSISSPVYEATVSIKKEKTVPDRAPTDVTRAFLMNTLDEVETEIEILKSYSVLKRAIGKLDLFFTLCSVSGPKKSRAQESILLREYQAHYTREGDGKIPKMQFQGFSSVENFPGGEYYIHVASDNVLELYDRDSGQLLLTVPNTSPVVFELPDFRFSLDWPFARPGSQIHFRIENMDRAIQGWQRRIRVEHLRKTGIFRLSVRANSPFMAQLIANTIAEEFRETRFEQKRQTIHYSHNFIDSRLQEIYAALQNTEKELSAFRSRHQIADMDEVTAKTIEFVSNLEAEKIKTELQLAEYQYRNEELGRELHKKGYFDQSFLTPNTIDRSNYPFASLLEQLSRAELERIHLLQKRTEDHPDVQALNERIATIKDQLSDYNKSTMAAYQIIVNSLSKKQADLERLIRKYSTREQSLPALESTLMELTRKKNVYEKIFTFLLDKREEMRMAGLSRLQDIVIVDAANLPLEPIWPRKKFNLLLGLFLGLLNGFVILCFQEFQYKKVKSLTEIEQDFQIPILGILPEYDKFLKDKTRREFTVGSHADIFKDSRLGFKESYRVIRTKLSHLMANGNTILFTSCEANTGKTTILANFAVALGLAGKKILLIDCDLKKSKLGEFFYLDRHCPGLKQFLTGEYTKPLIFQPLEQVVQPPLKLWVIPAGGVVENSSELLDSPRFKAYLQAVAPAFDYIFIDTPPITKSVDCLVLGSFIKDVILIIRPDVTYKASLLWALQELHEFDIHILGSVVNGCDMKNLPYHYKYGYGYGYGYADHDEVKALPKSGVN